MGVLFTDFYTLPGYEFTTLEAHDACVANGAMSQLLLWFGARSRPPCPSRVVLLLRGGGRRSRACSWAAPAAALGSGSLSRPSPLLPALLHVHRPCRSPIRAGLLEVFGAIAIDQTLRGSGREAGDFGESAPLPPAPQQQARTGSSRLPLLALKRAATRLCAQASTRSA